MHVLYKKVYSLCIYDDVFLNPLFQKFWVENTKVEAKAPIEKKKSIISLPFHITTAAGSGPGDHWPHFHLESSRVIRKWEVQRILGEKRPQFAELLSIHETVAMTTNTAQKAGPSVPRALLVHPYLKQHGISVFKSI